MTEKISYRLKQNGLAWSFAAAIFVSAFLVFQVQPVISKVILPWFGGSPAVWTTCMLFFQTALFAGYAYAHWSVSHLKPKWQGAVHLVLIVLALSVLPITPSAEWKPADGSWPTVRILGILATSVGLPYFLLASSGPLLQAWFGQSFRGRSPYRLYALSNTASMLGLLTYPFIFEPAFTTVGQDKLWSLVFTVFALLSSWLAWRLLICADQPSETKTSADATETPTVGQRVGWLMLAAYGSAMLLATTNHVCQDVAVVPLLWVIPLSLYLLSFIICFDSPRWYSRFWYGRGLIVAAFLATIVSRMSGTLPVILEVGVFFGLLLMACMVCHGELVRRRPDTSHLTMFYQYTAAGGAVGGILVSVICPQLFSEFLEMNVGLLVAYLLGVYVTAKSAAPIVQPQTRKLAPYVLGYAGLLAIAWGQFGSVSGSAIAATRNFYGVLTVKDREVVEAGQPTRQIRELRHGRIQHGSQWLDEEMRRVPTTYFAEETAAGQLLRKKSKSRKGRKRPIRVGIIGLGAGTLAAYGNKADYYRFYEINPDVVDIAERYFTYLSDLPSECDVVLGDARISLEREEPQQFDVLILDAFSGDAVPAHLITVEAMEIYLGHLKDGGSFAVHISNRHIDLLPVVAGLCRHYKLAYQHVPTRMNVGGGSGFCEWVVVSRTSKQLGTFIADTKNVRSFEENEELPLWTDSFSNILGSLRQAASD